MEEGRVQEVDPERELTCHRARAGDFDVVDVPPLRSLAVDGVGDCAPPAGTSMSSGGCTAPGASCTLRTSPV